MAAALGGAVAVTVSWIDSPTMGLMLGWDTVAALYTGWLVFDLLGRDAAQTARRATTTDLDRVTTDVILLVAAVASLVTVAVVLTRAGRGSGPYEDLRIALGVASVVLSWALVHSLYTLRYAALYYGEPAGGIEFNCAEPPTYRDFAYLSFTIGMTFQVSDTTLQSAAMRSTALRHALLSYLFGTGILATTVNLVASLRSG